MHPSDVRARETVEHKPITVDLRLGFAFDSSLDNQGRGQRGLGGISIMAPSRADGYGPQLLGAVDVWAGPTAGRWLFGTEWQVGVAYRTPEVIAMAAPMIAFDGHEFTQKIPDIGLGAMGGIGLDFGGFELLVDTRLTYSFMFREPNVWHTRYGVLLSVDL